MDFSSLCLHCRSYRRFKQVPVPKSVIDELMRNVSLVSCSRNAQKLRYYVISSDDVLRKVFPVFIGPLLYLRKSARLKRVKLLRFSSLFASKVIILQKQMRVLQYAIWLSMRMFMVWEVALSVM